MESSKLEWLENRKGMESPRNQRWLDFMRETGLAHENTDKLLPWLHREFNKGRLLPSELEGLPSPQLHYFENNPNAFHPGGIAEPYTKYDENGKPERITNADVGKRLSLPALIRMQRDLEEMKKRKQGIDLMQHDMNGVMDKVNDFRKWKGQQKRKKYGEVLHKFDNGWTVRRLQNDREHRDEGDLMHHCIGQPVHGYSDNTEKGSKLYTSLRDEMNQPYASMEITPNHWKHNETGETSYTYPGSPAEGWIPQIGPSSEIEQFFGPHDSEVEDPHREMMNEWLNEHGAPSTEEKAGADVIMVPAAHNTEEYVRNFGPEGHYMEDYPEDEEGRPANEDTEWDIDPPNYEDVANDLLDPDNLKYRDTQPLQDVFDIARNHYHIPEFDQALAERSNSNDPRHQRVMEEWERLKQPYYHPYTGEFIEGYDKFPLKEFQKPLVEYNPAATQWGRRRLQPLTGPEGPVTDPNDINGRGEPHIVYQRPQGPEPNPWVYSNKANPLYVRWVYSPSKGVTIDSNDGYHPALVKYHQGLGEDIKDMDSMHGYAYPIGAGWRITDREHSPVADPYIVNQVVRSLNLNDSPERRFGGSWRPIEHDFDRLHYGIPREVTQ